MVVRRRKKYRKKLGERTYHGNTKNRRGKGVKGGKGWSGRWGQKQIKAILEIRKEKGFTPVRRREVIAINVADLDDLALSGILPKEGKKYVFDARSFGVDKVLGRGYITVPVIVKNATVTQRAAMKIVEAGGEVEGFGAEAND
ncbi:MAG: large subunit ribosomal protein [Candidatus Diapherotrites archaeon]|nr:large subunit ribosomal protein [Candidatus Diapherotrites archaeon]MDN5366944.1 large subunit ribosomal protein [Candidatus Diapherotrites archaeon]